MPMARRRTLLIGSAALLGGAGAAGMWWQAGGRQFRSLADLRRTLDALVIGQGPAWQAQGAWGVSKVLLHLAQSVDYSLDGYPQMESERFRSTVGQAAWGVFVRRGAMNHGLHQPIPGATALPAAEPVQSAAAVLITALERFERSTGPLQPHFAYGALSKPEYTLAHLMHASDHWTEFRPT
ncbi:DUF1569 domain-containing protein [Ideonella sp.]|uniref:DUF1569 domain-containing protein n=1 Tax=Ideonella sp. TaxID=1929293 RepID=UPI003BB6504D